MLDVGSTPYPFFPLQIALVAFLVLFGAWSRISWFFFRNYPYTVGPFHFFPFFSLHYTLSGLGAASRLFYPSLLTRIMCVLLSEFQGACFELQGVFGALVGRCVLGMVRGIIGTSYVPSTFFRCENYGVGFCR